MRFCQRILGGGDATVARARRPEALAASLAAPPREGIDWLGRTPGPVAPVLYRVLVGLVGVFLFRVCGLQLIVLGRDRLPPGGYIAVSAVHRSWIDPLLIVHALPRRPRPWFMGSGPSAFDRAWKERLLRRIGGLLPVWRGGTDVSVHVRSAQAVTDAGAVLVLFAEGSIGGPPDAPSRMRRGAAVLALRTGAPIVPIAICGAEELYRHKRMVVRILDPTNAAELLGPAGQADARPGSRDELRQARLLTRAISARLEPALRCDYPTTLDAPATPRHWTWLTRLLR